MFETKYYKDYRHNYMILKGEDVSSNIYQCKMLTGNTIAGLLPCQEKHINGETLLYYEITSKQTLAGIYENTRISMKQLRKLFVQLKMTWEEMCRYLLDESGLVLCPEYIYVDVETGDMLFLYYPFASEEKYITSLLEFLLERVDSEDRQAVEVTYKMYELVEKEQFVLDEVLQWFEQDYEASEESGNSELLHEDSIEEMYDRVENEYLSAANCERNQTSGKKSQAFLIGLLAGVMTAAILLYLFINYDLGQKETVYFYAALATDMIVILVCLGGWCYEKYLKSFLPGDTKKIRDRGPGANRTEETPYQNTEAYERVQGREDAAYGNTVFIPWAESRENKLYGMGKGNKNHIDLNRLPLTVGKLAGSVDLVIADQSISRRHVKFVKEGSSIYMTDLNSTNGTFKNGFRLDPNTSEMIEPGDEIRLGKLKFIYR